MAKQTKKKVEEVKLPTPTKTRTTSKTKSLDPVEVEVPKEEVTREPVHEEELQVSPLVLGNLEEKVADLVVKKLTEVIKSSIKDNVNFSKQDLIDGIDNKIEEIIKEVKVDLGPFIKELKDSVDVKLKATVESLEKRVEEAALNLIEELKPFIIEEGEQVLNKLVVPVVERIRTDVNQVKIDVKERATVITNSITHLKEKLIIGASIYGVVNIGLLVYIAFFK